MVIHSWQEDEDDEPHVVDGAGESRAWRSLGALAKQATGGDDEGDEGEVEAHGESVVRKASAELKGAREKRLSVMKFVEDAATPAAGRRKLGASRDKPARGATPSPRSSADGSTPSSVSTSSTASHSSAASSEPGTDGYRTSSALTRKDANADDSNRSDRAAKAKDKLRPSSARAYKEGKDATKGEGRRVTRASAKVR